MIRLTSHRFAMFSKQFGRLPEEDDELFFDATLSHPVRATHDEIRDQVLEASEAYGLNCFSLLNFLGLSAPSVYDERVHGEARILSIDSHLRIVEIGMASSR
jgi:hypothetical protein